MKHGCVIITERRYAGRDREQGTLEAAGSFLLVLRSSAPS